MRGVGFSPTPHKVKKRKRKSYVHVIRLPGPKKPKVSRNDPPIRISHAIGRGSYSTVTKQLKPKKVRFRSVLRRNRTHTRSVNGSIMSNRTHRRGAWSFYDYNDRFGGSYNLLFGPTDDFVDDLRIVSTTDGPKNTHLFNYHRFDHLVQTACIGSQFSSDYDSDGKWISTLNITGHVPGYDRRLFNFAIVDPAAVQSKCDSKLFDSIRNSDLNLAIDLAEVHQTGRMVKDAVKSILNVRGLLKRRLASLLREKKSLKSVSAGDLLRESSSVAGNGWLSYQYGWKQAYLSCYGLLNFSFQHYQRRVVKVRSSMKATHQQIFITGDTRLNLKAEESRSCEYLIEFLNSDSLLWNANRITTFNPLSIAWELLPYSFVVDWFIGVGNYLQNLEASVLNQNVFSRGFRTSRYRNYTHGTFTTSVNRPDIRRVGYAVYDSWQTGKERVPLESLPLPQFPRFAVRLGWQRLLSSASLLRQLIR